jgi:GDPmannose 4,6-dehydratase
MSDGIRHGGGVHWHFGDLTERRFRETLLASSEPEEIYNLAAVSSPTLSWRISEETAAINALVPQQICEWLVAHRPACRLFQASSSEIFGRSVEPYQNEETPCAPQSPYAIAKLYAHNTVRAYRRQYGLHACSGIMFNHESPRRPLSYVSQKIAHAAAAISLGIIDTTTKDVDGRPIVCDGKVRLGNLDVRRDFGFAGDYVEAMHLILQHEEADDYVIGTGESHSVQEFCELAFQCVGRDWRDHVEIDPSLLRRLDNSYTCADARKLRAALNWAPRTGFRELVDQMVMANIAALNVGQTARHGRTGLAG